jgi:hypothetical protein
MLIRTPKETTRQKSRNANTLNNSNSSFLKTQVSKLMHSTFDRDTTFCGVTGGSSSRLTRGDITEVYVPLKKRIELSAIDVAN